MPYVVILEDQRDVAELLREAFRTERYRCFVLRSRASGERFLRRVRPDLVVVDFELMEGSGLYAAQQAAEANVPVIVTSWHLDARWEAEGLGFSFMQKPFRLSEITDLAAQLTGRT